jgi:hypothetical protein
MVNFFLLADHQKYFGRALLFGTVLQKIKKSVDPKTWSFRLENYGLEFVYGECDFLKISVVSVAVLTFSY